MVTGISLPPGLLFVFRNLILKWFRSVVHVQLQPDGALAAAKLPHALEKREKRVKVVTNLADTLKCFVICSDVLTSA